jgi:hypothetical protein
MSLVSASGFIGGVKEYTYRGIQQLPLILASTSLIFSVTTGSIAHTSLTIGLGIIMPIYTFLLQSLISFISNRSPMENRIDLTRSTGDTCNIIPSYTPKKLEYYVKSTSASGVESVPSYWLMSISFFVGFCLSNAITNLNTPAQNSSDENGLEKRYTQSAFVVIATIIFAALLLSVRFFTMRGCEGRGTWGIALSLISALGASLIGSGIYELSKSCGARSSDLFGIMSQILPAAATTQNPIVCSSD